MKENSKVKTRIEQIKSHKKDILLWIALFVFSILILWNFAKGHYASDTYNTMRVGYEGYAIEWSLKDGRVVQFLIGMLAGAFQMPYIPYIVTLLILGIGVSCVSVIFLKNKIEQIKPSQGKVRKLLVILICYVTIFHFMFLDNLYFLEAFVMSCSVFLYLLAAITLVEGKKQSIGKAFCFLLLGVLCYQGTVMIFIFTAFIALLIGQKKMNKVVIKKMFIAALLLVAAYAINMAIIQLVEVKIGLENNRLWGADDPWHILKGMVDNFIIMIGYNLLYLTSYLFPKGLFLLILGLIGLMTIWYAIAKRNIRMVIHVILILLLAVILTTVMSVVGITAYEGGRLQPIIGMCIGALSIYLYTATGMFDKDSPVCYAYGLLLAIYFALTMYCYVYISAQHQKVNQIEKQLSEQVGQYIQEYEQQTGIEVTKAKFYNGANRRKGITKEIQNQSSIVYNAVYTSWGSVGAINFYNNRNLQSIYLDKERKTDEYKAYAEKKEAGLANNFVCIGNTLYFTIYI